MTREELTARLAECEGHTPGPWKQYGLKVWSGVEYIADTAKDGWVKECKANARLIALAPTLAAAVRSLRETVKAKDEDIARLKGQLDDIGKWHAVNPSIDQALNEGDGTYKP